MELQTSSFDDWKVLKPTEKRLDAHVAQAFKQALTVSVHDGSKNIVLDLSEVEFMDSSGLGAIIFFKQFVGNGAKIVLASVHPGVEAILKLTHLDKVFRMIDQPDQVLQEATQ